MSFRRFAELTFGGSMQVVHRKSTLVSIVIMRWVTSGLAWLALSAPLLPECFVAPPPPLASLTFSDGTIANNVNPHERVYPTSVILAGDKKTEIRLLNAPAVGAIARGSQVSVGWYTASTELKLGVVVEKGDATLAAYWPSFGTFYRQRFVALAIVFFWAIIIAVATLGMTRHPLLLVPGGLLLFLGASLLPYYEHISTVFWCVVFLTLQTLHGPTIRARAFLDGNVDYVSTWP